MPLEAAALNKARDAIVNVTVKLARKKKLPRGPHLSIFTAKKKSEKS